MANDWYEYQEEAAAFFRKLGLEATTNATIKGVRTSHDIDVLVKSQHVGFEVTWLVECKHWKTPVSKLHVLALREIVADTGADRGILLCEAGFQSGAKEAANLTNVQPTSLGGLVVSAANDVWEMRLRELFDRMEACRVSYWDLPKALRIDKGLRPDVPESGYSGGLILQLAKETLSLALRSVYPFQVDTLLALMHFGKEQQFESTKQVVEVIEPLIVELEMKLAAAKG